MKERYPLDISRPKASSPHPRTGVRRKMGDKRPDQLSSLANTKMEKAAETNARAHIPLWIRLFPGGVIWAALSADATREKAEGRTPFQILAIFAAAIMLCLLLMALFPMTSQITSI